MSDFDEEAERERLREKYERDKRKRQATERMSDLLLKGATMTNAHCGECGDPIFRHDGQEFCPSCERVVGQVDDGQAAGGDAEADDGDDRAVDADAETPDGDDAEPSPADATSGDGSRSTADATPSTASNSASAADSSGSIDVEPAPSVDPTDATPTDPESTPSAAETGGDARSSGLSPARTALIRTVNELARTAAASDDLGRTREYLVATREAAEALEAVEDVDR